MAQTRRCDSLSRVIIATFNINNVNRRLPNLLAWLRRAKARRRLPAGTEGRPGELSREGTRQGGLSRRLGRPAHLERRRHPGARRRADPHPHRPARRSRRQAGALHRGRRQRRADRLPLRAERQSAARTEIRLQAGMARAASAHADRASQDRRAGRAGRRLQRRARPNSTSIRPSPTPTTRWCSPRAAPPSSASSAEAGPTRCARSIPDERIYTFWDYKRLRWPRDAGLRLDHLLLSAPAAKRLADAGVDKDVRGRESASDHAPVWIRLT